MKREKEGRIDLGVGRRSPEDTMNLAQECQELRAGNKILEKEIRRLKEENEFLEETSSFFRREPSEVKKGERLKFIAQKLSDSNNKRNLSLYCRVLRVSRQGLYDYLERRGRLESTRLLPGKCAPYWMKTRKTTPTAGNGCMKRSSHVTRRGKMAASASQVSAPSIGS